MRPELSPSTDAYQRRNPWRWRFILRSRLCAVTIAVVILGLGIATVAHWFLLETIWVTIAGLLSLLLGLTVVVRSTRRPREHVDRYDEARPQLEHEDNLLNHRVSWLMTSQSFLFAAYALQYTQAPPAQGAAPRPTPFVFNVIPVVALVAAGLIYLSVVAAVGALENIRLSFHDTEGHMPLASAGATLRAGLVAPLGIPVVLVCVWTLLIVRGTSS